MAFEFIQKKLDGCRQQDRVRKRIRVDHQTAKEIIIAGEKYINFSSNDYLGLAHHPEIAKSLQQGVDKFGATASASSLVTGFHYAHQALEDKICQWLNRPRCLLFNSGFSANMGVLSALAADNCYFILDKLSHASLIDGATFNKQNFRRFPHNNITQLEKLLSAKAEDKVVVTEGVFSMDGDSADISTIAELAKQYQALCYVDEAHSLGVLGNTGSGLAANTSVDIVMGTFGKALATSGAFIACSDQMYQYLVNFSRHYIYSTAISPALAWSTIKSIELIQQQQWRRDKISQLSEQLIKLLDPSVKVLPTNSSIHAIVVGDEADALSCCEKLKQKGIWLTAIRPPTVPNNSSRLRVTLTSSHDVNDIKHLANSLNEVIGVCQNQKIV